MPAGLRASLLQRTDPCCRRTLLPSADPLLLALVLLDLLQIQGWMSDWMTSRLQAKGYVSQWRLKQVNMP